MKLDSKDDVVRREIAARVVAQEHEFNAQGAALDAATARFLAGYSPETHEGLMKRLGESQPLKVLWPHEPQGPTERGPRAAHPSLVLGQTFPED